MSNGGPRDVRSDRLLFKRASGKVKIGGEPTPAPYLRGNPNTVKYRHEEAT